MGGPQNSFVKKSIEKALQDLPALPNVVARVLRETESPDANAATVERMISADQALASKVLRVVNSAYYGLSGQVTSLSQAIVILGMHQVRNLVLSVSAISMMRPKTPRQHEVLRRFWLHSFGTAAAASLICQKKRIPPKDAEMVFVGGLLHDIGRLFLFSNFTQTYDQVIKFAEEKGLSIEEAEVRLLGMGHGEIGEEMAKFWKLPPALVQLIARHEGPFGPGDDPMILALHCSDMMTKNLYFDQEFAVPTTLDPVAEQWLGFTEDDYAKALRETEAKVEEASNLFGMMAA